MAFKYIIGAIEISVACDVGVVDFHSTLIVSYASVQEEYT